MTRPAFFSKVMALLVPVTLAACGNDAQPIPEYDEHVPLDYCGSVPASDTSIKIAADSPALVVTDPAALDSLGLYDLLGRVLESEDDKVTTPAELMGRMFDTMNRSANAVFHRTQNAEGFSADQYHCDDADNPAFANHAPETCPRAEGKLATSEGFFKEGDPDHFYPVAVVNRFDLLPVSANTCGEYRIVYAKESGRNDPENRVFMIFEGSLPNPTPGCLVSCRPVAEFWRSLESVKDPAEMSDKLRGFFFDGLPAAEGRPAFEGVVRARNYGLGSFGVNGYYSTGGQLRISQHMEADWEMREFVFDRTQDGLMRLLPKPVGNNIHRDFFAPPDGYELGVGFANEFAAMNTATLAGKTVEDIGMVASAQFQSGESLQSGPYTCNYHASAAENDYLHDKIDEQIEAADLNAGCPTDDPLDSEAILRRATMQTCAGCHGPSGMLGEERKLGCGVTWPDSLNGVHIDEKGTLSPGLKETFLPHRADVLTTYLQASDEKAIWDNIGGPTAPSDSKPFASKRRTIGGSSTH
jgi:hypothetical protein